MINCFVVPLFLFRVAAWMSPEMIRREVVTEKCDIWSYGVILWVGYSRVKVLFSTFIQIIGL